MATFSVSLPDPVARKVDSETRKRGFATRSEFIRALLRRYFARELEFEEFTPRTLGEVRKELTNTGKYNTQSIESVIRRLSKHYLSSPPEAKREGGVVH